MPISDCSPLTPARQAGRILAAWAAGDEPLLRQELQKSQNLDCSSRPGLDEERLELLMAISEGMMRVPHRLQTGRKDPAVRRCLDLLAHLAQTPGADSN
jgi:hypothetical protein